MGLFSSKSRTIPATGYYAMPPQYQQFYADILTDAQNIFFPDGDINSAMFTPLAQTADETEAFERMRAGFTPTPETLAQDIAMLMNPFDEYVINDINRQSQGANSLVKQQQMQSGQMGSNRDFLGASDVEQNRLNSIGQFRQGQYNAALDASLGTLSGLRQQDANNLLGIGSFQRDLDFRTKTAPYTALTAAQGALNAIPTSFGNFGTPEQKIKSGGGFGGLLGSVAPVIGSALGGPIGGAIGGAVGGAMNGGGFTGAITGGLSGGFNGGMFGNLPGFGSGLTSMPGIGAGGFSSNGLLGSLASGNSMGQSLGSLFSRSPTGPYQPVNFFGR